MYKSGITRQEVHDNKVNIIFAVIGAILIVLARFPYGVSWGENVLDSIGCGCMTASIISIFMYKQQKSNEKSRNQVFLKNYLQKFYDEISMMMQRMIWFSERMDDETFEWNYALQEYSSLKYMLYSSQAYPSYNVDIDELGEKAKSCSNKYSLPTVEAMSDTQLEKLHKMVQIIVSSSTGTLEQCKQLDNNKVVLDSEGLIPIETIEKNAANVGIAFTILCAKGKKNYGLAYSLIFQVLLSLRAIGGFTNDYSISLQGRIKAGEL